MTTSNTVSVRVAGTPVPPPPAGVKYVFHYIMENAGKSAALNQAYLKSLYDTYAPVPKSYGVGHPSAPNYLATSCGELLQNGSDACHPGLYPNRNLIDALEAAGKTYTMWAESATSNCPSGNVGNFACRHYPWTYYKDVLGTARCVNCKPIASLLTDFPYAQTPPSYTYVGANVLNDGHNSGIAYASNWLSQFLPKLMAQSWWPNAMFIATMDEHSGDSSGYTSGGVKVAGGAIYTVFVGEMCKGKTYAANSCHYNTLATIMSALGITGSLGNAATSAFPAMTSLYA